VKPLGMKAYGSIPHLPDSRVGPGDHHCSEGQADIATFKTRDRHDVVYVEEKLDGSCCSAARLDDGSLVALGRAGYLAQSSQYEQHQLFAAWVRANEDRFAFLGKGQRVVGEWLAQAHGTRYDLSGADPFVAFDVMSVTERVSRVEFWRMVEGNLTTPRLLNSIHSEHGTSCRPMPIEVAMSELGRFGFHGALDPVEGAVWRVERQGKVDFLAKYVRPDKADGCYLPEVSGQPAVWNWRPSCGVQR
jgi:hypothetical protein